MLLESGSTRMILIIRRFIITHFIVLSIHLFRYLHHWLPSGVTNTFVIPLLISKPLLSDIRFPMQVLPAFPPEQTIIFKETERWCFITPRSTLVKFVPLKKLIDRRQSYIRNLTGRASLIWPVQPCKGRNSMQLGLLPKNVGDSKDQIRAWTRLGPYYAQV